MSHDLRDDPPGRPPHSRRHHDHPHHGPGRHRDHFAPDRLVEALRVLCDAGRFETVEALAAVAASLGPDGVAAAGYLMEQCTRVPVSLAIEKLGVRRREEAHLRRAELIELARKGRVALIMPLPPHILDMFCEFEGAVALNPDGHEPPPHLRALLADGLLAGVYDGRLIVRQADLVLFDAFIDSRGIWIRRSVADLLDPLGPEVRLGTHFRPHKFAEDRLAPEDVQRRILPI